MKKVKTFESFLDESLVNEARAPKTKEELISALDDAYSKLDKYNTKYYEISTAPGGGKWSSNSKEGKAALKYKKMADKQQANIWKWTDKLRKLGFEYNTNESVVTEGKVSIESLSIGNTYKDSKGYPVKVVDISGTGNSWKITIKDEHGKEKIIKTSLDKGVNLY